MKARMLVILIFFLASCTMVFAQGMESAMPLINSPEELVGWLSENFKYEMKVPDRRQALSETLASLTGDCEDMAVLCQKALTTIGIPSEIVVIKFRKLNMCHAICVFKDQDGYSFISNKDLIRARAGSVKAAVDKWFPDWQTIMFATSDMSYTRILNR